MGHRKGHSDLDDAIARLEKLGLLDKEDVKKVKKKAKKKQMGTGALEEGVKALKKRGRYKQLEGLGGY